MPQLPLVLGALPEALQRSLYDAFQLQVRYHRPRHEVTIRVTIRAGALPSLTQLVKEAAGQPGAPTGNGEPDDARSHVPGAPGKAPTSWEQLTGARQLVVETRSLLPGQPRSQLP